MKKDIREWSISFPWGKVAMVSYGNPEKPPILLLHGYMDSAATFIALLELLPDTYYYVGLDLPGHGKSDPYPPGILVSHLCGTEVVRGVVEHMKWNSFACISHSRGFFDGTFYNHFYPGKLIKMVHLDPAPTLSTYYYSHFRPLYWYMYFYDSSYNNYDSWINGTSRELTIDEAINLMVRNRSLTEEQAEVVLSRSLIRIGDDKFRLSWEPRMKKMPTVPLSEETLYTVITEHSPPVLIIEASDNKSDVEAKKFAEDIIAKCRLMQPNWSSITVTGGHDVHITNPELIVPHIVQFLNGSGLHKRSKL
ncbi:unnamed protein product [Arctia plantaginis]|uniref:AB hydrolase-1 domain-containing protein n=1 Tax=Arctia plantaginis TaxID=874455 RepID=A0A8S0YRT2_ARCPL|nr:unnamed protein product [Arctia plantaginis]